MGSEEEHWSLAQEHLHVACISWLDIFAAEISSENKQRFMTRGRWHLGSMRTTCSQGQA